MGKNTHLLLSSTLLATMSCAPAPNLDALEAHMLQCGLSVGAPVCSYDPANPHREAASRAAFAFAFDKHPASIEACILAVDCSDERMARDFAAAQDEVNACYPDSPPHTRSESCLNDCLDTMHDCSGTTTLLSIVGLDEFCDAADVTWCLEEQERCNESC